MGNGLPESALVEILVKPKNALVKQYRKLFDMENIKLEFDPGAIRAIAHRAMERNTGARGLRSIMEEVMTDLMYEVPSKSGIQRIVITEDCIMKGSEPKLFLKDDEGARQA